MTVIVMFRKIIVDGGRIAKRPAVTIAGDVDYYGTAVVMEDVIN